MAPAVTVNRAVVRAHSAGTSTISGAITAAGNSRAIFVRRTAASIALCGGAAMAVIPGGGMRASSICGSIKDRICSGVKACVLVSLTARTVGSLKPRIDARRPVTTRDNGPTPAWVKNGSGHVSTVSAARTKTASICPDESAAVTTTAAPRRSSAMARSTVSIGSLASPDGRRPASDFVRIVMVSI